MEELIKSMDDATNIVKFILTLAVGLSLVLFIGKNIHYFITLSLVITVLLMTSIVVEYEVIAQFCSDQNTWAKWIHCHYIAPIYSRSVEYFLNYS